ncbi:hypothetical protein BGX26_000268 [Mortierella sp. AD094]|nr:hypothetical protein BGX26_000268 [Mortierella sp. AD094]
MPSEPDNCNRTILVEEHEESQAVGQEAEERMATATGHATPDHGEAGHAAAEHGVVGHAAEDNDILEQERSELLDSIARATHTICEWKIEGECVLYWVFAPFLPTPRMLTAFKHTMLEGTITKRRFSNPGIDDAAVGEAVRMYINGDKDDASARLQSMPRKMRNMFETFPNTDCEMQKRQKLKPDRPDILIKVREKEVLFGEITGPCQETAEAKNKWDLYRLMRYGKSFLDNGHSSAPLLQIIYTQGTYLELTAQFHGMYLLQEVGLFTIPTTISMIPTLLADLPVLFTAQAEVHSHVSEEQSTRKRSWGFNDIVNAKKRLI